MKSIGEKVIVIFLTICLLLGTFPAAFADSVQQVYTNALEKIAAGDYEEASVLLESVGNYEDSTYLSMYCQAIILAENKNYDIALLTFENLGENYRDCKLLKNYYKSRQYEVMAESAFSNKGNLYIEAYIGYASIFLFKDSKERAAKCIQLAYEFAVSEANLSHYSIAIEVFDKISSYLDSSFLSSQANADRKYDENDLAGAYKIYRGLPVKYQTHAGEYEELYNDAVSKKAEGSYDAAREIFINLGLYLDSSEQAVDCLKLKADELFNDKKYEEAAGVYLQLEDDANWRNCYELLAKNYIADKKYDDAAAIYVLLEDRDKEIECYYSKAADYLDDKQYDKAAEIYKTLKDTVKEKECYSLKAEDYYVKGQYDQAAEIYKSLKNTAKENECYYQKGKAFEKEKDYKNAAAEYLKCLSYSDSRELHYQMAVNAYGDDAWCAYEILKDDLDYEKAIEFVYNIACEASARKDYELSISAYKSVGYYKDAMINRMSDVYAYGNMMYDQGKYKECADLFAGLGDFSNAPEKVKFATYALAKEYFDAGNYTSACNYFDSLKTYKDSRELFIESTYLLAKKEFEAGNYNGAKSNFASVLTYKDSNVLYIESCYLFAKGMYDKAQYEKALDAFEVEELKEYNDTSDLIRECCYALGKEEENKENFLEALKYYNRAGEIHDVSERILSCYYKYAVERKITGDIASALEYFSHSLDYRDAKEQIMSIADYYMNIEQYSSAVETYAKIINLEPVPAKIYSAMEKLENSGQDMNQGKISESIHYAIAENALSAGNAELALKEFAAAGNYSNAAKRIVDLHYELGEKAQEAGEWDTAVREFSAAGIFNDARKRILETYYKQGESALENEDYDVAIDAFKNAKSYSDASERVLKIYYELGEKAQLSGEWQKAAETFKEADNYKDARSKVLESYYKQGEEYLNNGEYEDAETAFQSAGEYADSSEKIVECRILHAKVLLAENQYDTAYDVLAGFLGNDEIHTIIAENENFKEIAKQKKEKAIKTEGSYVLFGRYEQDNKTENGFELIEWLVLDVIGDEAMLISRYVLDDKEFNTKTKKGNWDQSTLREWLNADFLNQAFNKEEQKIVRLTNVDNSAMESPDEATKSGNNTKDKVFLLSYREFELLSRLKLNAKCQRTEYEKSKGLNIDKSTTEWWLRTKSDIQGDADYAYKVNEEGFPVSARISILSGIRPVIWVSIRDFVEYEGAFEGSEQ